MKFLHMVLAICLLIALYMAPIQADDKEEKAIPKTICPCPRNYDPVCAANKITYPNRCEYDCVRRDMERRGRTLDLLRSGQC